ncbi:MAG: hydantoinase [Candidatus Rokuibacteriota bacterium]|nr:MAG: hydantoinase [Candidatus Rokubacteria bacterium]
MRRIGIDVGGTNTDAVLLEDDRVVRATKTPTTPDVTTGIVSALGLLTAAMPARAGGIDAVMIGTTHFTNAVVQRRDLSPVAALRIGLPASASLPPFEDWPEDLARLVRGEVFMVEGGHEYDGRPIVPLDTAAVRQAGRRIRERGLTAAAIASVFSPLNPSCEEEAARILREECPRLSVTCSHDLGRIGLLERENATLLNACLVDLAGRTTRGFMEALIRSEIRAPLYITQNDGTVLPAEQARQFPVYSFASGPTNSMRGAAFLSKRDDAIVVDVGGTTTDIGALRHGFPREVAARLLDLGACERVADLPASLVERTLARIAAMLEEGVDRMKTEAAPVPLIAVGGGCFVIPERLAGVSEVVHVPHQAVANAVGAAIAQVSGEVDQIFQGLSREEAIARARQLAEERAVRAGADPASLQVVEVEDLPLAYLPGNSLRTRVRVVGDVASH